jgi:murein DD-endopeptidase MepM/ murein hydrolase activator NlpD
LNDEICGGLRVLRCPPLFLRNRNVQAIQAKKIVLFPVVAVAILAIASIGLRIDARSAPERVTAAPKPAPTPLAVPAPTPAKDSSAHAVTEPVFPVAEREASSIVSRFGDPRDGGRRPHLGIDIAAPRGTPVLAVSDGRIERVDVTSLGGRTVWLKEEGSKRRHYFAHLESFAVSRGQKVRAGQKIGTVGTSGNAANTPPHLHYSVREGNDILDPASFLLVGNRAGRSAARSNIKRTRLNGAALKAAPGGATIAVLPARQSVTVLGEKGRYYRVRYRGQEGYLARWLLDTRS